MGRKRKHQGEKSGRFTRLDGSKDFTSAVRPKPNSPKSPEACLSEYPCKGEVALVSKAVQGNWPIPESMKQALVDRMEGFALHAEPTEAIAATRVIVSMEKQNVDAQKSRTNITNYLQVNNQPATAASEVDHDYLHWKRQRLMGVEVPEPRTEVIQAPLGTWVESRTKNDKNVFDTDLARDTERDTKRDTYLQEQVTAQPPARVDDAGNPLPGWPDPLTDLFEQCPELENVPMFKLLSGC